MSIGPAPDSGDAGIFRVAWYVRDDVVNVTPVYPAGLAFEEKMKLAKRDEAKGVETGEEGWRTYVSTGSTVADALVEATTRRARMEIGENCIFFFFF